MADVAEAESPQRDEYLGVYVNGVVHLSAKVAWPDGIRVSVRVADVAPDLKNEEIGKVVIAGFGLSGRWVADIFDRHCIDYVIIEKSPETIAAQRKLGREVVEGDVSDEATLRAAGIEDASILALTVPDEQAVLEATQIARRIKPGIYIVARTSYSSAGMRASQLGANDVVKAEQAVARQFYEMMLRKLGSSLPAPKET